MTDRSHFTRMSEAAANLPPRAGLQAGMLGEGDVVTFSRNKITGDRSYTESVWRLLASNGTHGQFELVVGHSYTNGKPIMLLLDEYEFYDGRPFLPAV